MVKSNGIVPALFRIFCDWGFTKPTKKPGEEFMGAPAPLWDNPAPRFFLYCAILALLIWLAMLGTLIIKVSFDIACEIELINLMKDIAMIAMLIDFVYLFRMSSFQMTDDRHWSRSIVIMFCFTLIYLVVATILILIKADLIDDNPSSNCIVQANDARGVIAPLAAMVLLYAAGKIAVVLKVALSLYLKTARYLSRNRDPGIALP